VLYACQIAEAEEILPVVPDTNPTTENPVSYTNPTPTPVLSNVNVSGYLYVNNTVTDEGETVPGISVLDVPACQSDSSGNESFLTQFSNSIEADYPEDWAKADVQELYAQLNKTLSESKPLPEYNAQAQVSSAYDDTSIPVGSDGHFDNTVLTGASDSNVKLEVALGEDNYAEVETLPSSGSIKSSDATGAAELKSCPEKIFAFPGEILIFKVYSEPGINLKSAGLRFTLNNASIGCITQPVYLCLFGAHKYQVAYGCVYIKPGLDTPVDTTITAKLNSGQSMNIFLEVIKKTASISGTVYTGGSPLIKGYVTSLGPKACCKIDSSGAYSLPKVFRGHSRAVIATWWTSENGQKVRHREEKVIDFLNADVTGFNFGVPPTPTPTSTPSVIPTIHPPSDHFYDQQAADVIGYYYKYREELGEEGAIRQTIDWINGAVSSDYSVPEGIIKASAERYSHETEIILEFNDGMIAGFETEGNTSQDDVTNNNRENISIEPGFLKESYPRSITSSNNITFDPAKILIMSPFSWEFDKECEDIKTVHRDIANILENNVYYKDMLTKKITGFDDIKIDFADHMRWKEDDDDPNHIRVPILKCRLHDGVDPDKIVSPYDYETMGDYGLVYILTHGNEAPYIMGFVVTLNHPKIEEWMEYQILHSPSPAKGSGWRLGYFKVKKEILSRYPEYTAYIKSIKDGTNPNKNAKPYEKAFVPVIVLEKSFFSELNNDPSRNFKGSIIFMAACSSINFRDAFSSAEIYFGYDSASPVTFASKFGYYLLSYMMDGPETPVDLLDYNSEVPPPLPNVPQHVLEAYQTLTDYYHANHDINKYGIECHVQYSINYNPDDYSIYFPVPINVIVDKNKKMGSKYYEK